MSEHEIEDAVEASVKMLATHAVVGRARSALVGARRQRWGSAIARNIESAARAGHFDGPERAVDRRSVITSLYDFQSMWDVGFVHFRCIDTLLESRSLYRFRMSEHPDYAAHKAFFDRLLERKQFKELPEDVARKWDSTSNPTAGYYEPDAGPDVFFDAGSSLWGRFVAQGSLVGDDARAPTVYLLPALGRVMAQAAVAAKRLDVAALWYALVPQSLCRFPAFPCEALMADADLVALRKAVLEHEAYNRSDGWRMTAMPEPGRAESLLVDSYEGQEAMLPFLAWWFEPFVQ